MGYQFYTLARTGKTLTFNDSPPAAEGWYGAPRQQATLNQMERGTVHLDYGIDPANMVLKLTFEVVPDFLMRYWEAEYNSNDAIDAIYELTNHRNVAHKVKWKSMRISYLRTLPPYDAASCLEHYSDMADELNIDIDVDDPDLPDIADLYKVEMEFFVVPDSLFG